MGPLSLGFDEAKMQGEGRLSQRVLITAGAAGIGREFARAFAATGARVFVCDIDEAALAAIAREIPGVIAQRCDMGRRAEIERMVPDAVAQLGGLDVLINNAGIAGMTLPVADYPPDDWDKVVAVNLTAMFDVTRLAIPHLKLSKAGVIINMSSVAGRAQISGKSMTEVRAAAMAEQSIKEMIDPKDIAALAVFLASDAGKSISGQVLPIDNDRQRA